MNKKGMNFSGFGIALLYVGIFSIFFGTVVGGFYALYPTSNLDTSKTEVYQNLAEQTALIQSITGNTSAANPSDEDFTTSIYTKGFVSIKLLFVGGPSMVKAMLNDLSGEIGLPAWVVGFVLAIIILLLILLLIGIFIKTYQKL